MDRTSPELWPEKSKFFNPFLAQNYETFKKEPEHQNHLGTPLTHSGEVPRHKTFYYVNPPVDDPNLPTWAKDLDNDDINVMHQIGSLTTAGLISEVKNLYDVAHQLNLEEIKELTRGQYLNILAPTKK